MNRSRRRAAGFSAAEVAVGTFLSGLVLVGMLSASIVAFRASDRGRASGRLAVNAQAATDEVLYQLRGGTTIQAGALFGLNLVTTSATSVAFKAQAYDDTTNAADPTILDAEDEIAFFYDARVGSKELVQYIRPASGSSRPARSRYVLARNVQSVSFRYWARDRWKAGPTGSFSKVLSTATEGGVKPDVYLNGAKLAATSVTYTASSRTVAITIPTSAGSGADIEALYPVSPPTATPTAAALAGLKHICQVDAVITVAATDNRQDTHRVSLTGRAFLRNNTRYGL